MVKLRRVFAVSLISLISLLLMSGQQQPSKEYIRIGDRVIAIENPVLFSVNISPASAAIGMADTQSFTAGTTPTCTTNCTPTWQVVLQSGDSGGASIIAGVLTPTGVGTVHVQATIGTASATVPVTILPVFSPGNISVTSSGGPGAIAITKQGSWTVQVSPSASWFHFTNPPPNSDGSVSGTGNQTVSYLIDANSSSSALNTNLTLAGFSLPVSVGGTAGGSAPTVGSVSTLPPTAGSFTLPVTYNGIPWSINENLLPGWISLDQNSLGFANPQSISGTVTFDFLAASGARSTSICVAYGSSCLNVPVNQSGGLNLSPPSPVNVPASGGNYTLSVTAPAGTQWSATVPNPVDAQWLLLSGASGTGSGSFLYETLPNSSSQSRTGTINVSGLTFVVNQSGAVATLQISPGSAFFSQQGHQQFNATLNGAAISVNWALGGSACGESLSNSSTVLTGTGTSVTVYAPLNCASSVKDTLTANSSTSVNIFINYPNGQGGVQGYFGGGNQPYPYLNSEVIFPGYNGSTSSSYYNVQFSITGNSSTSGLPPLQNSCAMQTNLGGAYSSNPVGLSLENDTGSAVVTSPSPSGVTIYPHSSLYSNALSTVPFNSQCEIDPALSATNYTVSYQQPLDVFFGVRLRPAFAANNSSYTIWVSVDNGAGYFPVNPIQIGSWSSPSYLPPTISWSSSAQAAGSVMGTIPLIGWAFDNATNPEGPIASVQIQVDGVTVRTITSLGAAPSDGQCPGNLPPLQPAGLPSNSLWNCGNTINTNYNNIGWNYQWDTTTVPNGQHTITVIATDSDPTPHTSLVSRTFTVSNQAVAAPSFTPPPGSYASTQVISLATTTPNAFIRYTTDGVTVPTETTGTLYSVPISVPSTTTIKAIAFKSGMPDSPVISAMYTIIRDLTLNNLTINAGTVTYQAINSISANSVTISGSASVTFKTGNVITLYPGFSATAGTGNPTFHAVIDPTIH